MVRVTGLGPARLTALDPNGSDTTMNLKPAVVIRHSFLCGKFSHTRTK